MNRYQKGEVVFPDLFIKESKHMYGNLQLCLYIHTHAQDLHRTKVLKENPQLSLSEQVRTAGCCCSMKDGTDQPVEARTRKHRLFWQQPIVSVLVIHILVGFRSREFDSQSRIRIRSWYLGQSGLCPDLVPFDCGVFGNAAQQRGRMSFSVPVDGHLPNRTGF